MKVVFFRTRKGLRSLSAALFYFQQGCGGGCGRGGLGGLRRFLTALPLIFSINSAPSANGEPVRVAAVEPYVELVQAWGEAAGIAVRAQSFEPNECVRRVGRGDFDLALLAETLSEGQKRSLAAQPGAVPRTYPIGWEAATLIVHPENSLPFIREDHARSLFSGDACRGKASRFRHWNELPGSAPGATNPIGRIIPRVESAQGAALREILCEKECGLDENAYQVDKDAVRERIVAASPEAIGVVYQLRHLGKARPLPVLAEGKTTPAAASTGTLNAEEYPFGRKIWLAAPRIYYDPEPAAKLTAFALSPAGQFEVARMGFFPLR